MPASAVVVVALWLLAGLTAASAQDAAPAPKPGAQPRPKAATPAGEATRDETPAGKKAGKQPAGDQAAGDQAATAGPPAEGASAEGEPSADAPADGAEEPPQAAAPAPPKRLYEQEPYDLIKLDAANDNAVLKVMPLLFEQRSMPAESKRVGRFEVRLFDDRSEKYEVAWRNVESIVFFEELVLREANRIVAEAVAANAAGDMAAAQAGFDEAFLFFRHLLENAGDTPGLKESIQEYLYLNAGALFRAGRLGEAFAILEDLYSQNPQYSYRGGAQTVVAALERLGDRLIGSYVETENYRGARMLLERLQKSYGDRLQIVRTWRDKLIEIAQTKRAEAEALLAAGKFHEAHVVSREMFKVWPTVEGGRDTIVKISEQYPLIVVGVSQPALEYDPQSLVNSATRRCGSLLYRTLVEYVEQQSEGGLYASPWATIRQSDDRRALVFDLLADAGRDDVTAFDLSSQLLMLADPSASSYQPTWASLMASVAVQGPQRVHVDLRRPSLLPQAYLQVRLDENVPSATAYQVSTRDETGTRFEPIASGTESRPKPVVVERFYPEPRKAIQDLRKGQIDMVDRLLPTDAARLRDDESMVIGTYAFPALHVLLPNAENPFLANRTFRRALVYGINRPVILHKGLLGEREIGEKQIPGCRVISAAIPAGLGRNDPLAYAYDERIQPLPYDPVMAAILMKLAQQQLAAAADQRQEPAPELGELVLAHPAGEQASFVCKQIQAQLDVIGIKCKLRPMDPGETRPSDGRYDLLYLEIMMREPLIDLGRVFGPGGIAAAAEPFVALTLRQLDRAETWKDARERMYELHRLLYEDVTVVPLWQMVDHFVHHTGLRGVPDRPIFLYQDVEQWRVIPPTPQE
jgi:ABC-type oligopeptide transport system substrate-binding subunit